MSSIRYLAMLALMASVANGQSAPVVQVPSNPKIGQVNTPKPELPLIDEYACPGKGETVPNVKIDKEDRIYSSWNGKDQPIGTLKTGQQVTVLAGVNVIREPGTAVIKYVGSERQSLSLQAGDLAFVYGLDADENFVLWSKGAWFAEWIEGVAEHDQCGFTSGYGPGGCTVNIIRDGKGEWWVQVKTDSVTGWVLAAKYDNDTHWYGNFSDLCHYGED